MNPAGASVWKAAAGSFCGVKRAERPCRLRQRWMPLRDSCGLTQRRMASQMSIERQGEAAAKLDDEGFFAGGHRRGQAMPAGRAIEHVLAGFPARHGEAVDAELAGQGAVRGGALLNIGAGARGRGGIGMQLEIHQPVLPSIAALGRRERLAETLAPVGPQGPPARRSARLVTVAARARGSLLWTTGTSCDCACNRRSFKKETACHSRAPSRQSSGTKHEGRDLWWAWATAFAGVTGFLMRHWS